MPLKDQVGKKGRKPKPKSKVIVRGGDWVDALQGVVQDHPGLTILRVSTKPASRTPNKARPWVSYLVETPIRRIFVLQ